MTRPLVFIIAANVCHSKIKDSGPAKVVMKRRNKKKKYPPEGQGGRGAPTPAEIQKKLKLQVKVRILQKEAEYLMR